MGLAEKLRPKTLDEVLGQGHLLGKGAPLRLMVERAASAIDTRGAVELQSMILWGPPGSGKTTIARLLGAGAGYHFEEAAATSSGLTAFRKIFETARETTEPKTKTIIFVDEIHRLTRTQQDVFLPVLEEGLLVLVGATTENPSFALSSALLSRARVFVLERLDEDSLELALQRAEKLLERPLPLDAQARAALLRLADGDGRFLLTMAQSLFDFTKEGDCLEPSVMGALIQSRAPIYDRANEAHYNLISAFHKAIRGSDVDGALYWLARMLVAGEDAFYILRRLARAASEDIGMADPHALPQVLVAKETYAFLGAPEGELAVAQAVIYCATAPKSNAAYKAWGAVRTFAQQTGSLPPPKNILNAPTALMKDLGYGKDYVYEHNHSTRFSGQNFFPDGIGQKTFYTPAATGFEKEIQKRLDWWQSLRRKKNDAK